MENDVQPSPPSPPNNSRKQLMLMLGIMAATLGGPYLLFVVAKDSGVWGTVNKGEFVKPARSVTDFNWRTVENAPFSAEFPEAFAVKGSGSRGTRPHGDSMTGGSETPRVSVMRTWWLLAVAGTGCDIACDDALSHMRSLQILLTKDATRVRRALVLPNTTSEELSKQYPKLVQLSYATDSTTDSAASSLNDFSASAPSAPSAPSVPSALEKGIYIVDPTGVLVLRYPLVDSAVDIQKDLKRLLKYSQLG